MKRKQLESLLTALLPVLRHFVERQIATATINLRSVLDASIEALPKPKDGVDGKSVTIDEIKPLVAETVAAQIPKASDVAAVVLEEIEIPTAERVAEKLQPSIPTADQVAELARAKLIIPTAQEVAALVPSPKAEEIAEHVKTPQVPTLDEIIEAVIAKVTVPTAEEVAMRIPAPPVPTAEEVAKLVNIPVAPTAEEVALLVKTPEAPSIEAIVDAVMAKLKLPTAKEIAAEVPVPSVELPDAPTREEVTQQIEQLKATIPTAADVAKLVELPELPKLPELPEIPTAEEIAKLCVPMLPEPPSVEEVVEALKHHIPQPVKGDKGDPGERGESVDMAAVIAEVTRLTESNFAKWALDFERRALDRVDAFLRAIEKPRDGVDGKDGLGFDDLRNVKAEQIDDRIVRISVQRGEESIHLVDIKLSHPLHKGVFVEGVEYARGDQVTRDGCAWIALKESPQGKPGSSDDWQLAVKKGRDGRDGDDPDKKGPPRVRIPPRK
jgi:hypothetical protein